MRTRCGDVGDPVLSRKASSDVCVRPVPETDTGGQVENTKATGELWLRNSAKCPRNFGRRGTIAGDPSLRGELVVVAESRGKRLFTKNTGPCEDVKSMYTD